MSGDAAPPAVPHIVKGRLAEGSQEDYGAFATPKLDMDSLVWMRSEAGPAFDLPAREVVDFLEEVGRSLAFDDNPWLQQALAASAGLSARSAKILEHSYRGIASLFARETLEFQIEEEIGWAALDGWAEVRRPDGSTSRVRAFPPRLVHILAGNTPGVTATSIVRGALSKGVHLLKLPSDDLFTASAILRTMAEVDAQHPTLRSFSAVYWPGGNERIESAILRAQFFDKVVVWGGESAVRGALRYVGPGFEVVSFDPKISISMVGREALASEDTIDEAAKRAATDVALLDQDACAASRYVFIEGETADIDRFCARLAEQLQIDRPLSSGVGAPTPGELRNEIDVLRTLEPIYRVWGDYQGGGIVIRSEDPVDFYPTAKTVNVVSVESLEEAVRHANVATQTVGIFPRQRSAGLRDALAAMGVQRVVALGEVARGVEGLPHDGFYPIRRVMRWVLEDAG